MQTMVEEKFPRLPFWVSVLLHILLLISVSVYFVIPPPKIKKSPQLYVPSFIYKGAITPAASRASRQQKTATQSQTQSQPLLKAPPLKIEDKYGQLPKTVVSTAPRRKSMLAASYTTLAQSQFQTMRPADNEEPILLIGDEHEVADPLIKLMARALSANFNYPKQAGMFGIKGRVLVKLTLHPAGYITDVQMVRSSSNEDLDAAALYAANSAPTVMGAARFISQPKNFIIGFVFN